jgi:hypothetical protein
MVRKQVGLFFAYHNAPSFFESNLKKEEILLNGVFLSQTKIEINFDNSNYIAATAIYEYKTVVLFKLLFNTISLAFNKIKKNKLLYHTLRDSTDELINIVDNFILYSTTKETPEYILFIFRQELEKRLNFESLINDARTLVNTFEKVTYRLLDKKVEKDYEDTFKIASIIFGFSSLANFIYALVLNGENANWIPSDLWPAFLTPFLIILGSFALLWASYKLVKITPDHHYNQKKIKILGDIIIYLGLAVIIGLAVIGFWTLIQSMLT